MSSWSSPSGNLVRKAKRAAPKCRPLFCNRCASRRFYFSPLILMFTLSGMTVEPAPQIDCAPQMDCAPQIDWSGLIVTAPQIDCELCMLMPVPLIGVTVLAAPQMDCAGVITWFPPTWLAPQ